MTTIIGATNEHDENTTVVQEKTIQYPMRGSDVKSHPVAKDYLSIHEVTEVSEYDEIFYLAPPDKKYKPTKLERLVNNGFDDSDGYYRLVSGD